MDTATDNMDLSSTSQDEEGDLPSDEDQTRWLILGQHIVQRAHAEAHMVDEDWGGIAFAMWIELTKSLKVIGWTREELADLIAKSPAPDGEV